VTVEVTGKGRGELKDRNKMLKSQMIISILSATRSQELKSQAHSICFL
jgi:hypothetical protein